MSKIEALVDLDNLQNETSAVQVINSNSAKITEAVGKTLSRDGSTPNAMEANLDIGLNRIINVGAPQDPNDAVRYIDLEVATGALSQETLNAILASAGNAEAAAQSAADAAQSAFEASQYIGSAVSADHWTSSRTISLGGVLSGSQSFDGSANFSLSASYVDGSITASKLASGVALSNLGYTPANIAGATFTGEVILADTAPSSVYSAGYRGIPVVPNNIDYTFLLSDAGKMHRHDSASTPTWTVPPNSSVPFPIGTVIVGRSVGSGNITIAQGSGVLIRIPGTSTTGNRTAVQWSRFSLIKEDTDSWIIEGTGIS